MSTTTEYSRKTEYWEALTNAKEAFEAAEVAIRIPDHLQAEIFLSLGHRWAELARLISTGMS